MPSEEELILLFKESGVEFIEEAAKATNDLGDSMNTVNQTQQAAIDVLKEESTVLDDLKNSINALKVQREELTDKYLSGLITEEHYNDASKDLEKTLAQKEGTLKRVTNSVNEQIKAAQRLADELNADALAAKQFQDSLLPMQTDLQATSQELLAVGGAAEMAAGIGKGEGEGGFAGLAGNVLKAEKIMTGLVSGSGFGRMGPMLESITGALGLAGGVGMAGGGLIFAFEALLPKIEAFIEKMTGAAEASEHAAAALKAHNEQVERQQKNFEKLAGQPTKEEAAGEKDIESLLGEGRAPQIRQGIMAGLTEQGFGLFGPQQDFIKKMQSGQLPQTPENLRRAAELLTQQQQAVQEEANHWIEQLPRNQRVQEAVSGMAQARPQAFPDYTRETLFAARPENVRQAEIGRQRTKEAAEAAEHHDKLRKENDAAMKQAADMKVQLDNEARKENDAAMKFADDWRNQLEDKAFKEATRKAKQARELSNKAAKEFERQDKQKLHDEEKDDRQTDQLINKLLQQSNRIVGMSARGVMDQQTAAVQLQEISGQIDWLIAQQQANRTELQRHRQMLNRRAQQNTTGAP
jgi:hypothetical protein